MSFLGTWSGKFSLRVACLVLIVAAIVFAVWRNIGRESRTLAQLKAAGVRISYFTPVKDSSGFRYIGIPVRNSTIPYSDARELTILDDPLLGEIRSSGGLHLVVPSEAQLPRRLRYDLYAMRSLRALEILPGERLPETIELKALNGLTDVILHGQVAFDAYADQFGATLPLEDVEIEDAVLSKQSLQRVVGTPGLKSLRLVRCTIEPAGLNELSRELRTLSLAETLLGDEGALHLARCHKLEDLDLSKTGVGDVGCQSLAKLASLKTLNLNSCPVTSASIPVLSKLASLQDLWMEDTQVDGEGLDLFLTSPQLKWLAISGPQLPNETYKAFCERAGARFELLMWGE
ncbi:MAG TPA: hypothetical protein VGE52_07400 [Pirellulales bacterium]